MASAVDAALDGYELLPNSTLFSGDELTVKKGMVVVALSGGGRLVFGKDTTASFQGDTKLVGVSLGHGNVSLVWPQNASAVEIKSGEISIVPRAGIRTLGDVSMIHGVFVARAREGVLRVEGGGARVEVVRDKPIVVQTEAARRNPGTGAHGKSPPGAQTTIQVLTLAAGATTAALAGLTMARFNDAKDAAKSAITDANSAIVAANSATASAQKLEVTAVSSGCAIDALAPGAPVSPFTPPAGFICP